MVDVLLCDDCAASLDGPAVRCEELFPRLDRMDGCPPLPIWTAAAYAGPMRGVVLAWKDRGRADLTGWMQGAVGNVARAAAPALSSALGGRDLRVVPVPSRAVTVRRRGRDLTAALAAAVASELHGAGVRAACEAVLVHRGRRDQAGLGARARGRNPGMRLMRGQAVDGAAFLLVDDVVTTGATLAACEDTLSRAGGIVLGGVVVAATPGVSPSRRFTMCGRQANVST